MASFVDDPAVAELSAAIERLEREVNFAPYVEPKWLLRWKRFVERWHAELTAYGDLGEQLDPEDGRARLDAYGDAWHRFDAAWESGAPTTRPADEDDDQADDERASGSGAGVVVLLCLLAYACSR